MRTDAQDAKLDRISYAASIPFAALHLSFLLIPLVGIRWEWAVLCLLSYYLRMMAVTIGYHRYFAHRTFKTSRVGQFLLAFAAQTTIQKGALWWAAHHRHHHRTSDQADDIHSPLQRGFWWSHVGWILARRYDATRYELIKDFARFPELKFLNEYHLLPALLGGAVLYAVGGLPVLLWGGFIPTVLLWHGTFTINSLSHVFGKRRYLTTDTSRNNWLLALLTCGEGWHNNHHYHQNTANQGWYWWEVDVSFYALKLASWVRLVWDVRVVSEATRSAHLRYTDVQRAQLKAEEKPLFARPDALPGALAGPAPVPVLRRQ
ncbi:MAG: fatty acid desaturase [Myxococcaceae bacterium]|nr:fatty acid desaturase [Myxococcaceae bacterium]